MKNKFGMLGLCIAFAGIVVSCTEIIYLVQENKKNDKNNEKNYFNCRGRRYINVTNKTDNNDKKEDDKLSDIDEVVLKMNEEMFDNYTESVVKILNEK